jgi:hypothetical protein
MHLVSAPRKYGAKPSRSEAARDEKLADEIRELMRRGATRKKAIFEAAKKHGVSLDIATNARRKYMRKGGTAIIRFAPLS